MKNIRTTFGKANRLLDKSQYPIALITRYVAAYTILSMITALPEPAIARDITEYPRFGLGVVMFMLMWTAKPAAKHFKRKHWSADSNNTTSSNSNTGCEER